MYDHDPFFCFLQRNLPDQVIIITKKAFMKKLLFLVLGFASLQGFAQNNVITNGKIEMSIETGNTQMPPMTMTYFIKGSKIKMDYGAEGMFEMSTYQDNDKNKVTFTMNMMGMKKGFTATPEELAGDKKDEAEKPQVKITEETKDIAGYKCKKAIITSTTKSGEKSEVTVWYTPDLKMPKMASAGGGMGGGPTSMISGSIDGLPMEIVTEVPQMGTMTMKTTTVDLKADIKDDVFAVPTDVELKSYKEFREEMKGMMGGGN